MNDKQKVLEKWSNVIKGGYEKGQDDCAYCKKYTEILFESPFPFLDCSVACPIRKATGKAGCEETPYKQWKKYAVKAKKGRRLPWRIRFIKRRKALRAAKNMYKFLETLPED